MGGRDKPGHDAGRARSKTGIAVCRLALVATIGLAGSLAGCSYMPGVRPASGPQPVAYAQGRNPCVEYAEDIYGRRYCRRHYAD